MEVVNPLPKAGQLFSLDKNTMGYRSMTALDPELNLYMGSDIFTVPTNSLVLGLDVNLKATMRGTYWLCLLTDQGMLLWVLFDVYTRDDICLTALF